MSNTLIQIKRSTTTAIPPALEAGELAFTSNGDTLWIGSPAGSNTANVINIGAKISYEANSTQLGGSAGGSNTELASTWAIKTYVDGKVSAFSTTLDGLSDVTVSTAANNDLLVYDAASGQWENHTIGGTANEVEVTFASQNITVGLPANVSITDKLTVNNVVVSNTFVIGTTTPSQTGAETKFHVANSTIKLDSSQALVWDGSGPTGIYGSSGASGNVYINVGNNGNTVVFNVQNTVSSNVTSGAVVVTGGVGVSGRINTLDLAAGNTTAYSSINGTSVSTVDIYATGTVNAASFTVGGWVVANNSGVFTSGVVNADIIQVGSKFRANTTQVTIANDVALSANGTTGSAGQVLTSNGTTVYWSTIAADITAVTAGNGLSGGGSSGDVTLNVNANNGIISNSTGVFVHGGVGVTVNTGGVHIGQDVHPSSDVTFKDLTVNGNTALGSNSSDVVSFLGLVNTSILPSANVTYNLGNNTLRWAEVHAQNVHSVTGKFDGNVEIAGDLTVTGNVVTVNVSTLSVSDPLIQLASNNTTSDILDIGFYGSYETGSGPHEHAGLFRDATDGVFKLFKDLTESPTTTVNTAGAGYATATLFAYLTSGDGGGLNTNATSVAITANSTVNVAIVANTLSLSSALGVASGGTGKSSITNNAVLFGYGTGVLQEATGSNGQVLQITANVPTFGGLDGGTF